MSTPETFRRILVTGDFPNGAYLRWSTSFQGVAWMDLEGTSLADLQMHLRFKPPGAYPDGLYTDQVEVDVCYDQDCKQPVPGSPLHATVRYTVTGSSATIKPVTLGPPNQGLLAHDVVDAAISRPLNAIVMVSAQPTNALYLYDLASRTERQLPLNKAPTALTLSADGNKAAVGHDALVTYVDLATAGQAGAPSPTLLNVSAGVFNLLLDNSNHVHVFPQADQWVNLHSIDIATNTETTTYASLYAKTRARLHPSGTSFYVLDTQLSPQNLRRFELAGGVASYSRQAPYWGDYATCGNLWFSEEGSRIFTACGNTFNSSSTAASDMLYAGRLQLTDASGYYYQSVVSVSDSIAANETAVLDAGRCGGSGGADCETLLRLYERSFLNLNSAYWMMPVAEDGALRPRHGMFVFHAADGTRWMISRLVGVTDPARAFYLNKPGDSTALPQ